MVIISRLRSYQGKKQGDQEQNVHRRQAECQLESNYWTLLSASSHAPENGPIITLQSYLRHTNTCNM